MSNKYKWIIKSLISIFCFVAVLVCIIGLCIGKVVEATLLQEIFKWLLLAVICGAIACIVFMPIVAILDNVRDNLYPEFGKKWFLKWIKNGFRIKM